ncbi:pectinesterase-like [Phragmites australis]|uniref:pectinesterase-like n=1 Tax=Phragmites australis TaxID=29695 RepID=UPI002D7913CD|nr:pectinesterase-like [Phragmites australis]
MASTSLIRAISQLLLVFFVLLILLTNAHTLTPSPLRPAPTPPTAEAEATGISPGLVSTMRETLDVIRNVASIISSFPIGGILGGGDLRLSSAVADCLDLLDLSSDELSWSMSTTSSSASHPSSAGAGGRLGTGDARSDLRSWLSGALGNQDTCKEGLDETGSVLGSLIATGLEAVTSLLTDGLGQIAAGDAATFSASSRVSLSDRRGLAEAGTPRWLRTRERRLLQMPVGPGGLPVDAVVAKDGSGNFTTVNAAVEAAPAESAARYVIYVKKGVYKETVDVKKKKWNLMLVGDGMGVTVISGHRNYADGYTTYRSATISVNGKGFIARDLTFENTAGPAKHQAVALRCDSDLSVFYRCAFEGYQDTLYAHSLRQFYSDCRVTGTVDFVFGNAAAVFQNCTLLARLPLPDQKNSVTAQGRLDANMTTGFAFQFCKVSAHDDLLRAQQGGAGNQTAAAPTQTYLGRPWKQYSRVVFMQSYIGAVVRPEGWLAWDGEFALDTLYYGEYMNTGPGAGIRARVKWPGFHVMTSPAEASNFTVAQFIEGNMWLPPTGVKYTVGLTS